VADGVAVAGTAQIMRDVEPRSMSAMVQRLRAFCLAGD
jgi:hypothetical protein